MDKDIVNELYGSKANLNRSLDDIWNSVIKEQEKENAAKTENNNKKNSSNQVGAASTNSDAKVITSTYISTYGLDINNLYSSKKLEEIYYLDNYTEILATRTSSSREALNKAFYQMKTDTSTYINKYDSETKSAITLAAANQGREENFMACFGAPFSYLEVVDPYGRVYKDTFGLRREETWHGTREGLMNANTDSKVFIAYIKVGMVSQVKGKGLVDIMTNAKDQVTGNSENIDPTSKAITSFSLSYFVNADSMIEENSKWRKGQIIPFNKFILNALTRLIMLNTSPAVSGLDYDNRILDKSNSKEYKERRENLFKKINNLFGDNSYPFFKFVCSEESIVNETIQTQIGESFLKGLIDRGSELSREVSFVTGGGDALSFMKDIIAKIKNNFNSSNSGNGQEQNNVSGGIIGGILDTFTSAIDSGKSALDNVFGKDLVDIVLKGNSLIYPRVWKGSSIEKMLSLQMRFYSPYGDWFSIFMNIIIPLVIIMGFSLPRQVYPSFISYPFGFSIQIPGLFQSEMAMVTNIAIRRGGRYDAWSENSIMRGVDITLDVTPLKPMYGLPEEIPDENSVIDGVFAPSNDIYGGRDKSYRGDITFANMLRNMAGSFIMSDQELDDSIKNKLSETFETYDQNASKNSNVTVGEIEAIRNLNLSLIEGNQKALKKLAEKNKEKEKSSTATAAATNKTSQLTSNGANSNSTVAKEQAAANGNFVVL